MAEKHVTSRANPTVKTLRSLSLKKHRDAENLFIVEGVRHVQEALKSGWRAKIIVHTPEAQGARDLPADQTLVAGKDILRYITGRENAQDIIGAFEPRWKALEEIRAGLWVGLEDLRDPGNLGTILRTCHAAGAQGVILIGETCDPFSPEALRASMGSFANISLARCEKDAFLAWRKTWPGKVYGTHVHKAQDYRGAAYTPPLLLLLGGEQNGLSAPLADACDTLLQIPMPGGTESLNVAVATGIFLFEAVKNPEHA